MREDSGLWTSIWGLEDAFRHLEGCANPDFGDSHARSCPISGGLCSDTSALMLLDPQVGHLISK